jgi:hypothetical protein
VEQKKGRNASSVRASPAPIPIVTADWQHRTGSGGSETTYSLPIELDSDRNPPFPEHRDVERDRAGVYVDEVLAWMGKLRA